MRENKAFYYANLVKVYDIVPKPIFKFYLTAFFITFGISFLVFSFYIYNFLFGNHDFYGILSGLPDISSLGRPFSKYPAFLLASNYYLPLITPLVDLFFLSVGAVLFCVLFDFPKKLLSYILVSLLICVSPFLLSRFYYTGWMETFVGFSLVIGAFVLIKNFPSKIIILISSLLFYIAIGMYTLFINTIGILFIFTILRDIYDRKKICVQIRKKYIYLFISISLSLILFIITFLIMKHNQMIFETYITKFPTLSGIVKNLFPIIKVSFQEFYISQIPFTLSTKLFQCFIIIAGLGSVFIKMLSSHFSVKIFLLFVLCSIYIFLLHNISAFITPSWSSITGSYGFRAQSLGFMLIPPFFAGILLSTSRRVLSVTAGIFCGILIWMFAIADARAQLIWKIGLDKEYLLRNRVLSRIEEKENFKPENTYKYVQVGYFPNWGKPFTQNFQLPTVELARPYEVASSEGFFFQMMTDELKLQTIPNNSPEWYAALAGVKEWLARAQPWPSPHSIKITADTIFLIMDGSVLSEARKQIDESLLTKDGK